MLTKYRIKIVLALMIFMLFAFLIDMYNFPTTGKATSATAASQVDIQIYFAISASTNLSADGIKMNISALPALDNNASANYAGTNQTQNGRGTSQYNVTVSGDSNVNVDFCLKASGNLTLGATSTVINMLGYRWANFTTRTDESPNLTTATPFSLSNIPGSTNVGTNGAIIMRFWLNVSAAQSAGVYNNTITFTGRQTGVACP